MSSPRGQLRALRLYQVPPSVHYEFCRVMDVLSDVDWTRFASAVLRDQTTVRLAKRKEQRTDWVMVQWQSRNGSVGEILDLLEGLTLLRPRDILLDWLSSVPLPPVPVPPAPPASQVAPPPEAPPPPQAPPTAACLSLCPTVVVPVLPKPPDPPSQLLRCDGGSTLGSAVGSVDARPQPLSSAAAALVVCSTGVMAWAYEEVHAGTYGFCPTLKVGEGGFGEVFRANLRNTDCAVKKFKQDCSLDWNLLKDSFQTEVEKLSKFRHPNIVDLLGYSEGGGSFCLIYSFLENMSLDDQLHSNVLSLSWPQRVSVVKEAATALQFLHCPPEGHAPLVHGDVKSSNILLGRHFEAKLADFGLAQFSSRGSSARTSTLGQSQTVRGTLAYLPEEYIRDGKLRPATDVYSFGVVLLEILTGRRALERDKKTGRAVFLKDIMNDLEDSESDWRKQLDQRLVLGGAAEPTGYMQVVSVAQRCLDKCRKRPSMTEVYEILHKVHISLKPPGSSSSSLPSVLQASPPHLPFPPEHPRSLDSCFSNLSLSTMGPLEHSVQAKLTCLSPPHPLHSSHLTPSHPLHSSALPPLCSSFEGPCETDESRGYSQYNIPSQRRSNGLDQSQSNQCLRCPQTSVPTEDQYNFPMNSGVARSAGNIIQTQGLSFPECTSPAGSLQSLSPANYIVVNPSKQRLLHKKDQYEQGLIGTPELLSSEDLYKDYLGFCGFGNEVRSPAESRLPEESDELE